MIKLHICKLSNLCIANKRIPPTWAKELLLRRNSRLFAIFYIFFAKGSTNFLGRKSQDGYTFTAHSG